MTGTYLAGAHELRTMVYTETGNGDPESTETLVNTIDGTAVRLLVEGHPLDVRTGSLLHHERVLDFRAGTLSRELRWRSPGGRAVEVSSTRLVSLDQRGVLALRYTVRALERPAEVVLQSGLVANTQQPHLSSHPSADDLLQHPLEPQEHDADGRRLTLMHRTLRTGLLVGADRPPRRPRSAGESTATPRPTPDHARFTVRRAAGAGAVLSRSPSSWPTPGRATVSCPRCATSWPARLTVARARGLRRPAREPARDPRRLLGVRGRRGRRRRRAAAGRPVRAVPAPAGHGARPRAGDRGQGSHRHRLRGPRLLGHRDVRAAGAHDRGRPEVRGTPCAGGTRRCPRPASAPARSTSRRGVPLADDQRPGVLGLLAGRHRRLPRQRRHRRRRAALRRRHRRRGVRPCGRASRSSSRPPGCGASLGHWGRDERFHLFGVTGPDEYSALGDDNIYTNLMVQRNLRGAAALCAGTPTPPTRWRSTATRSRAGSRPPTPRASPTTTSSACTRSRRASPSSRGGTSTSTAEENYPLLSHYPYLQLYRNRWSSRPTLCSRCFLRGDAFTDEEKSAQLRLLRGDHRPRLVAVGVLPGGPRRRGGLPATWRTSTSSSRRWPTSATPSTTRRTACTSPRWPAPGWRWSAASAGCGTTTPGPATAVCRSVRCCPTSCRVCVSGCCSGAGCCG